MEDTDFCINLAFFVFQLFCLAIFYVTVIWSHKNFLIWFQYTMQIQNPISTPEFNLTSPWSHVTSEYKEQVLDILNQARLNF